MHKRDGLTALRVKPARKPGRHADGGGLYLEVEQRRRFPQRAAPIRPNQPK